jgi:RimJ/RimL family protein N-acetyltransferase
MDHVCRDANLLRITVNTQSNNTASLALYEKIGFHRAGEQYPVYIYRVENHDATG